MQKNIFKMSKKKNTGRNNKCFSKFTWISDSASDCVAFFKEKFNEPRSNESSGAGDANELSGNRRHGGLMRRRLVANDVVQSVREKGRNKRMMKDF